MDCVECRAPHKVVHKLMALTSVELEKKVQEIYIFLVSFFLYINLYKVNTISRTRAETHTKKERTAKKKKTMEDKNKSRMTRLAEKSVSALQIWRNINDIYILPPLFCHSYCLFSFFFFSLSH